MISSVIIDALSVGFRWIPLRVKVIKSTEQGLRWWWGKDGKVLDRGVYAYIPWIGNITTISTLPRLIETQYQPMETVDGRPVSVSVGIHYRVRDAKRWFTKVEFFEDSLCNLVQLHLHRAISGVPSEQLKGEMKNIIGAARKTARRAAWRWGVEIINLDFISQVAVLPIQLMTGNDMGGVKVATDD